jgi:hypothetical protein
MAGRWMSNASLIPSRSFGRQDVREGDFDHKAICWLDLALSLHSHRVKVDEGVIVHFSVLQVHSK